jgi:hypothetical protein
MAKSLHATLLCIGASVSLPMIATASESLLWKTDTTLANGNGCQMGDNVAVIAAADQVQLIFWNMGIYLPADSRLPLAQRKACTISMAIDLLRGHKVTGVKQTLQYGGYKTSNTEFALAGQVMLFGMPLKPLIVALDRGSTLDTSKAVLEWDDVFSMVSSHPASNCYGPTPLSGLFSARVVSQGQRGSDSESLILSSDMYDLRYSATLRTEPCPLQERN